MEADTHGPSPSEPLSVFQKDLRELRNPGLPKAERQAAEGRVYAFLETRLEVSAQVAAESAGAGWVSANEVMNEMWLRLRPQLMKDRGGELDDEEQVRKYATAILFRGLAARCRGRLDLPADGAEPTAPSEKSAASRLEARRQFQLFCRAIAALEEMHPHLASVMQARFLESAEDRFSEMGPNFSRLNGETMRSEARTLEEMAALLGLPVATAGRRYEEACRVVASQFPGFGVRDFRESK